MSLRGSGLRAFAVAAWPYGVILLLGLFVLMPKLGTVGFWDPWEPKYAETAREMSERGSIIVPYYREEVRLTKPILVYWGILAGWAAFGVGELGARAVGIAAALATMLSAYYTVSRLRGRQAGLLSALVLGTLPYFFFISRQAMPDVYLMTSAGCAFLFLSLALFGPARRRHWHFAASYAGVALAMLAKGPMIIGTTYFVSLAVLAVARIDFQHVTGRQHLGATLKTAAIAAGAAVLLAVAGGLTFLFGLSSDWWGYSDEKRQAVASFRESLVLLLQRVHGIDLLLAASVAAAVAAVLALRRWTAPSSRRVAQAVALSVIGVALLSWLLAGFEGRALSAGILIGISSAITLATTVVSYLRRPGLWPDVGPWSRAIGVQALLFSGVFLLIAGPWQLAILIEQGHGYFTDFILKHNVQRAAEKINRSGASDFYLRTLTFGFFPWSALLPVALAWLVDWRERNPFRKYGVEAYLLIVTCVTFAAFSIPTTKFPHYLSPIVVPVAVLVGLTLDRLLRSRDRSVARLGWAVAALLYVLPMLDLVRNVGGSALVRVFTMKSAVPSGFGLGRPYVVVLVALAAAFAVSVVLRSRIVVAVMVVLAALAANYATSTFIPRLTVHKTMKHLCETWRDHGGAEGAPIGFYGDLKHGIFFYTDYRVDVMRRLPEFVGLLSSSEPAFCIIEKSNFTRLRNSLKKRDRDAELYMVDDSHMHYALVSNAPPAEPAGR